MIDENCFFSKNLYNYANYHVRQEFFRNKRWIRNNELDKLLQGSDPYRELMSKPSQETLKIVDRNWKSFFEAIKDWKVCPQKYFGQPKPPKYLSKGGRFPWYIKNDVCYIRDSILHFQMKRLHGVTFRVRTEGRLLGVRFIPRGNNYVMEVVFEVEVPDIQNESPQRVAGIDLGVNNLVTLSNNIGEQPIIISGKALKSINQFYNKRKAAMQSDLKKRNDKNWSRALADLTFKRHNRVKTYLHTTSRRVIDWCVENEIDTLVCGLNKGWKQECKLAKPTAQKFAFIPYDMLIKQLEYKCESAGIRFTVTEESYTSGTSFLDGELPVKEQYNKTRRKQRGLFQAADRLINADVNGACQIIKKVVPNAFDGYGIEAVNLTPVVISIA